MLIPVVSPGGTIADLFIALPSNPAVQRALQCVRLGRHQPRCPHQWISPRSLQSLREELFADAGKNNRIPMGLILLARETRNLEIHQAIVTDVGYKVCASSDRNFQTSRRARHVHEVSAVSGCRIEEIENCLPDLNPAIGVRDEIYLGTLKFEDAALDDLRLRFCYAFQALPLFGAAEKCSYAVGRAPVEVVFGIFAISEYRRYRNDPLMLIVGKGDEYVNASQARGLRYREGSETGQYASKSRALPLDLAHGCF